MKFKRSIALIVLLTTLLSLFPEINVADAAAIWIPDPKDLGNLVKGQTRVVIVGYRTGERFFHDYWDFKVYDMSGNYIGTGQTIGLSNRSLDAASGVYNYVAKSKLKEWVNLLNGDYDFVRSRFDKIASSLIANHTSSSRAWIQDFDDLCGAYTENFDVKTRTAKVVITPYPSAKINYDKSTKAGETETFYLTGQGLAARNKGISKWAFYINNSKVADGKNVASLSNYAVKYTFAKEGTYTAKLEVTDNVGRTTTEQITVKVDPASTPPKSNPSTGIMADFEMPYSAKVNDSVSIKNTSKTSSGTKITKSEWTISPKNYTGTLADSGGTLKFTKEGTYNVTLKVTNDKNQSDSVTKSIYIYEEIKDEPIPDPEPPEPENKPPVAKISGPTKAKQGETITLLNKSYDRDGYIEEVKWSISPTDGVETSFTDDDATLTFSKEGTYKVTLKVWDDQGDSDTDDHTVTVTNEPPVARIGVLEEVIQGEDVEIYDLSYDPDGEIVKREWSISPETGMVGTLDGEENIVYFDTPGNYTITLTVTDEFGKTGTDTKVIKVKPDIPTAFFSWSGTPKENRKLTLDANTSLGSKRYPIDFNLTKWEFIPLEGQSLDNIKVRDSSDLSIREIMFKEAGSYRIRLQVTNTAGNSSEWYEEVIDIMPDEEPVADFLLLPSYIREESLGRKAIIAPQDISYSPDGDIIGQRIWKYRYDSDNDGSFEDEEWKILDDNNNPLPELLTPDVGKYQFELEIIEDFGQDTLEEFITPADYKKANTSFKIDSEKITEVINIKPVVSFDAIVKPKADISLNLYTNSDSLGNSFTSQANNLITDLKGYGIDISHKITVEKPYYDNVSVVRGDIYFIANRTPFDPNYLSATNYDYNQHIGDFGRVLTYSTSPGSNNYNDLVVYVEDKQKVGINETKPIRTPRVEYSSDGNQWNSVSLTYTGSYRTWSYLSDGSHKGRSFRFKSSPITGNVRYIRVRSSSGSNPGYDCVYVSAKAYGYNSILRYPVLSNEKLENALKVFNWRDNSNRYEVVVVNSSHSLAAVQEVANQYNAQGVKIIFVGTSAYKTIGTSLATSTGGIFIEFNGTNIPWDEIKDYIVGDIEAKKGNVLTILLNEAVEYKTYYLDTEDDPEYTRRWKYYHDENYFQNSMGLSEYHDIYLSNPITSFSKVGKYDVIFQAKDNPKDDDRFDDYRLWSDMPLDSLTILVHRKPLALFTFTTQKVGNTYEVSFTDLAYDLDHQYEEDKGIVERVWKWKELSDTDWKDGQPTTLQSGKTYYVLYRVKDKEGQWSDDNIKTINTLNNQPPIALFTVSPNPATVDAILTYEDLSYDPDGDAIIQRAWRYQKKGGSWVSTGSNPPSSFSAIGEYTIELKVQDSKGYWSDPYYQTIEVIEANTPPIADFIIVPNPTPNTIDFKYEDYSYDLDGDPIVQWDWEYREIDSSEWKKGRPEKGFPIGEYIVRLRVKDAPTRAGLSPAWSDWYEQRLTLVEGVTVKGSYEGDAYAGDEIILKAETNDKAVSVTATFLGDTYELDLQDEENGKKYWAKKIVVPNNAPEGTIQNAVFRAYSIYAEYGDIATDIVPIEILNLRLDGESEKNVYAAGQAMLLRAETEGRIYKIEVEVWYDKNDFTNTNVTTLAPDTPLSDPVQKEMTWHSRRTKAEGRDQVLIIPLDMPEGTYQVRFIGYKKNVDGTDRKIEDVVNVRVVGNVFDHSHSEIIGPTK